MRKTKVLVYWLGKFWSSVLSYLGNNIDRNIYELVWYDYDKHIMDFVTKYRRHPKLHKDIVFGDDIILMQDIKEAIWKSDIIVLAIPYNSFYESLEFFRNYTKNNAIVLSFINILRHDWLRMSEVFQANLVDNKLNYAIMVWWLDWENMHNEVLKWVTLSSNNTNAINIIYDLFISKSLLITKSDDFVWVEYSAIMKKVWSIMMWIMLSKWYSIWELSLFISLFSEEVKELVCSEFWWNIETFTLSSFCWWWDLIFYSMSGSPEMELWKLIWKWNTYFHSVDVIWKKMKKLDWIESLRWLEFILKSKDHKKYRILNCLLWIFEDKELNFKNLYLL